MQRDEVFEEVLRLFNACETHIGRVEVVTDYIMRLVNPLQERDRVLTALENGGVENWEWYEESLESLDEGVNDVD